MFKPISWVLVAYASCAGTLYAQLPFCSTSVEPTDCSDPIECYHPDLPCEVSKRYSREKVRWLTPSPLDISVGDVSCDLTYYFNVTKAADDNRTHLNSERAHWNQSDEIAFFVGPNTASLTFYNAQGDQVNGTTTKSKYVFSADAFLVNIDPVPAAPGNWSALDKLSEVRWHPTLDKVVYHRQIYDMVSQTIVASQLVQRSVNIVPDSVYLGPVEILFEFAGYALGDDDYALAGGDGNDVHAGRLLLSLKALATGQRSYAVYDFDQDGWCDLSSTPLVRAATQRSITTRATSLLPCSPCRRPIWTMRRSRPVDC